MLSTKQEFIDNCADACRKGTFVTSKHHPSGLPVPQADPRSVNCMDNAEMEQFLRTGDFCLHVYSDSDPRHSPELYVISPSDPTIVPGSGVPALSTTPTTQCDTFAVPSGYTQGWHGYAYTSAKVKSREMGGKLTYLTDLV